MRRFLAFWIVLTPACGLAMLTLSLVVFRHADLTYLYFAVLVNAPVLQALVLAAATATPTRTPLLATLHTVAREPLALPVLLLDVLLLALGWLGSQHPAFGFAAGSVQPAWLGAKALVAGAFLLYAARDRASRGWLLAGGVALMGAGAQAFTPWIEPGLAAALPRTAAWPLLFRWLLGYGTSFVVLQGLLLRAGTALGRRTAADFCMQTAVALGFCVGLVAVHGFFRLPHLVEPWLSLGWTAGSLSVSAALLGAILAGAPAPAASGARS